MIKLFDILPELKARPRGYKFVEGDWEIKTEEDIEELEKLVGLEVTGDLTAAWRIKEKIKKLPGGYLKVGGNLRLYYTNITSLPNNLKVGGYLYLTDTKITSLPNNLKVGKDLNLNNTKITSLPNNFKVGGILSLRSTPITSLPNNLKVEGSLDLSSSEITSLPNNLKVQDSLYLEDTPLAEKYTTRQIRRIIIKQGGAVGGKVYRV